MASDLTDRIQGLRRRAASSSGQNSAGVFGVVIVLFILLSLTAPGFGSASNILDTLRDISILGLMAVGVTVVITAGGIDLSVGAVVLVAGIVSDQAIRFAGLSPAVAILLAIGVGLAVGAVNALAVAVFNIPPFIATLATLYTVRGIGTAIYRVGGDNGTSALIDNMNFVVLGQGYALGVPIPLLVLAFAVIVVLALLRFTPLGAHLKAIGTDAWLARMVSLPVKRTLVFSYLLSGVLAAISGVLLTAQLQTGAPEAGLGVEFQVIAAAVLGGASLLGGRGSILGAVAGAALVTVISKGLNLWGMPANYQALAQGVLIIIAVSIDAARVRFQERRRLASSRGDAAAGGESFDPGSPGAERLDEGLEMPHNILLSAVGISKSYGTVHALSDVSLVLRAGEIHALVGENGAGKSTLIKVLSGAVTPDAGQLETPEGVVAYRSPSDALQDGIAVIYQDRTVVPGLSVAENVMLGREPRLWGPVVSRRKMREITRAALRRLQFPISTDRQASGLSPAHQQLIDIARVLASDARIVIFDEPTASLSRAETTVLFRIIRELRAAGKAVLFIGHSIEEIFEIADTVTVLRDGQLVTSEAASAVDHDSLIRLMVGRDVTQVATTAGPTGTEAVLAVDDMSALPVVRSVSLTVVAGEIVGIYGLIGSGRSSFLQTLAGSIRVSSGRVLIDGHPARIRTPAAAIRSGIVYVPEDRKGVGVIGLMSVAANLSLADLRQVSWPGGWLKKKKENELAVRLVDALGVVPRNVGMNVGNLSGGNQQKVSIGRWLQGKPRVLLIDEPTQGVDVGAREEIYAEIRRLAAQGVGILFVSSYLPEVLQLSNRILVMKAGRIVHESVPALATEESLLTAASDATTTTKVGAERVN
jgi:ABC-type sugar transport system ATPase subunit/ribose/xylose/arabinose/galactoside ABC-type transport system permease subunit